MKRNIISILLVIIGLTAYAQTSKPQWNGITSDNPETFKTQLISSSENSIKVNVQVPGFYATTVTTPRGEANVITVPKSLSTAHAGEPDMPMTGLPLMIGDKARMNARVVDAQYMEFENIEVAPSKGDFTRQIDPATVPYTYGACYSQDAFFPASNLELYEPYIIRDFRGQNMAVYPFAYNPVSKTLRVYYNMSVEMYKVDDRGENVIETRRSNEVKLDPDFKSLYQRHFLNYESGMKSYTPLDEEGDLLIICYGNFMSAMTDFVNWKKTRGINTTIVNSSTAGSSYSAIKSYIQSQYNANNNLTHVLLVGDVAQIPGYTYSGASGYEGKGDNPYGQIVGNDIYNDLFIGRFSATSTTHVSTQVQKVITYERDLTTSATWCQKGMGVSTSESSGGHNNEDDYEHINNIRTDLLNYGYSTVYQEYYNVSGYSSTTQQISTRINSGVGIITYCNHGSETAWQSHSPYYSTSYVNALTNSNQLPFVFSVACLNGKYDHSSDCFAEAWMRATNNSTGAPTGAVGTMMSYISQPWVPPMWAEDEFADILCELKSNNIKRTWGGTAINSIMGIFDHYSTSTAQAVGTYQAWILYGDPTLMLRTKTPQAMTVNHAGTIGLGSSSYTVNVSNGNNTVATITDASHNILGKATVNNGTANISLNSNDLTPGTELTLCVFGYNKVTYLGTIEVVGGEQYDITVTQPQHGTISAPSQAYAQSTVTLTATPETGYCLSSWTVTAGSQNITVTNNQFVMPESDVTVTATFIQGMEVTLASVMHGTISADMQYALQGNTVNLTATPASSYMFDSWVVYKTGDVNTTVTVSGNSFTMPNYPVTVSAIFSKPAGGDTTIGSGTSTNNGGYLPTHVWYKYSLTQQIYTSSEVGSAGNITAISFYYNSSTSSGSRSIDVYLAHTSNATISSWQTQSNSNKVYSGSHTFTQGWNTITLNTPFAYNGTSNLLLTFDDNTGSYDVSSTQSFYTYSTGSSRAIYYYKDSGNPNPTTTVSVNASTSQYNAQIKITKEVPSTEGYLSVSSNNITGFEAISGYMASEAQNIAVIGNNLQTNLTVTAPTGFEVSTSSTDNYASTLTLTPSNGSIRANIFVRLSSNNIPNDYSGNLTLVSGSTTATVSLNGTVIPNPDIPFYITVSASPEEGGTVTGAGTFNYGANVTVTATANEGYTFINWTTNDTQVSDNATYSFTVTGDATLVANFIFNSYEVTITADPAAYGTIAFGDGDTRDELVYDFDDNTTQGWTILQGPNSTSTHNWIHSSEYTDENLTTGHNNSIGFMLSESYISLTGEGIYPDNYLVSPQVQLGGNINFWATNLDNEYGAEHFAVAVSTNGNSDVNDFTQVQEWTLLSKGIKTGNTRTALDGIWYEYTVDLSAFNGMGYVAIHHFDCYEQWLLCIDDITITEGTGSFENNTFNHGETCTVTATPNTGYYFVNWTENGTEVSSNASYTFTVTSDRDLTANFSDEPSTSVQTIALDAGWNWLSANLDITLNQLKEAIANALGSDGFATIKSRTRYVNYQNGQWRGSLTSIDITQMYKIKTSASCEITLTGIPVNPTEQAITITSGNNWIAFPLSESMSVNQAFGGFPTNGDIIKNKNASATFNGSSWRGSLQNLEPGHGYIYQSKAQSDRIFYFGTNNNQ